MTTISATPIVLASGSVYRQRLLRRILPAFTVQATQVDETPSPQEAPASLAQRLARAKAESVRASVRTLVIGADQVAVFRGGSIGKPGSQYAAVEQLLRFRGETVAFLTACYVREVNGAGSHAHLDETTVRFREFPASLARRYVSWDEPADCAGGFKVESAGPVLFEEVTSSDPTALIGLPLIWLSKTLESMGVELLRAAD